MYKIVNLMICFILYFVELKSVYSQSRSTYDEKCNSIVLKLDLFDLRNQLELNNRNRNSYIYVSDTNCVNMNFMISESDLPTLYRNNIELGAQSTYLDTCIYLLFYIKEYYQNTEIISASPPMVSELVKNKTKEFYHCTFNHLGIDWVARLITWNGIVLYLRLDFYNRKISYTTIPYLNFTIFEDKKKWEFNKYILLNN